MNRWIKLYSKTLDWEWFSDTNTWHVFSYLLLRATWGCTKYRGIELKPGQVVTSVAEICSATGLSTKKVRTALDHLKSTNEVAIKTTNRKSIITIENWAKYQSTDDERANKTATKGQMERQSKGKLIEEEYKNIRLKEKDISKDISKKKVYGEFQNVYLTDKEFANLIAYTGSEQKVDDLIERLSGYMASKGKRYKSHYATMQNWYRKDEQDELSRSTNKKAEASRTDTGTSIPKKWLEQLAEQGQVERSI